MSNKFSIKLNDKVFTSNNEGFLNLNDIWNGCSLPRSKRPSEFNRYSTGKHLSQNGNILPNEIDHLGAGTSKFLEGDEVATVAYAMWAGLKSESHNITVVTVRDETIFGSYLRQLFPDLQAQIPCNDGKYIVDFYIPSLKLYVEYDESFHKHQKNIDEIRESEIGGTFFRVVQGQEVEALLELAEVKSSWGY
jgi:hypothetical protein